MTLARKPPFLPLVKGWRGDTFFRAFFLNAIATSFAAASAASAHGYIAARVEGARTRTTEKGLETESRARPSPFERYVILPLADTSKPKGQQMEIVTLLVFLVTFLVALVVYNVLYVLVGFGGGMIAGRGKAPAYA